MPHSGNEVKFVTCTAEQYNSLEVKDEDTIYFITDDHTLHVDDSVYSNVVEQEDSKNN